MISLKQGASLLLLSLLALPFPLRAAESSFDIDLKELDRGKTPAPPKPEKKKKHKEKAGKAAPVATAGKSVHEHKTATGASAGYVRYTVKPGDHIFKILVGRFGMSNDAAEKLVPEIIRINNISNIKNLTVGRTLLIPTGRHRQVAKPAQEGKAAAHEEAPAQAAAIPPGVARLEARAAARRAEKHSKHAVSSPESPASALIAPPHAAPAHPATAPPVAGTAVTPPPAPAPAPSAIPPVPAAPIAPLAATWVCSVPERDAARIVDSFMNALSLPWKKNRIIDSDKGVTTPFSIRVDRYFEYRGGRYVVSIGENDPYSYTLIRLLETAGYRVLMIGGGDDFKSVGEKLLRLLELVPDYGRHALQEGKEATGFLVQQDDAGGRRVLITSQPVDPKLKWTLPAGCGAAR